MDWSEAFSTGSQLIFGKLRTWFEQAVQMLPNLILALLVLVVGELLARFSRAVVSRGLSTARVPKGTVRVLAGTARFVVSVAALFVALSVLQLDKTVTSLLAGAGVVGLALSFAFQDLASNFISGLFLTIQRPLRIGDFVSTNDFLGHVDKIGLRAMVIRDLDGQHVVIPSKDIFQSPLINYSTEQRRRVNLDIGVSYASDLEMVERVTKEAVAGLDFVLSDMPVAVHWNGFGSSSIDFTLRFWIASSEQKDYNAALAGALKAVKATYDAHDITIPFPIRTLDFGIEGGQTAGEAAQDVMAAVTAAKKAS